MTLETIQIKHLASGEVTVKLIGDHMVAADADEATIPYMITAAMWHLLKDGTVFKKITEKWGVVLEGSLKIAENTE